MELWKLPTGDSVSRYERSIVVNFTGTAQGIEYLSI